MKVKIRTEDCRLCMPVPAVMIGFVVRLLPDRLFQKMQENIPKPYQELASKESVSIILEACVDVIKENKGLEILHVEGEDGTFISIKL